MDKSVRGAWCSGERRSIIDQRAFHEEYEFSVKELKVFKSCVPGGDDYYDDNGSFI